MSKRNAVLKGKPKLKVGQSYPQHDSPYCTFDSIDGRHPWQAAVPEGFVAYPVRRLNHGKITYFNFALAREMGLIPSHHADDMSPELSEQLLKTFSIQILNEYDQVNSNKLRKRQEDLKPHPYMATRYLQLQHANKRGATSGDGRSVWNGTFTNKGVTWDLSSRGTGVTCLAPGAVEAQRPLKTGAAEFGYGCGLADVSELLGSAVLSEIFHLNGIATERVLLVIDHGKGCGIGVRASRNLLRPAHLFLYLKQGRIEPLKRATDFFIRRQVENGQWKFSYGSPDRYRKMLSELSRGFARFAALLERNYIFAWMDWDGDNILADAGIIDYGSIRQFGLRHDQYRYDDVDRFSTNLNEQRGKARLTVQVFAQLVDYLETGKRKSIEAFERHVAIRNFDREFDLSLREAFLAQCGFNENQILSLMNQQRSLVEKFYCAFLILEKTKTKAGEKRLPDGINRPAVFNMRTALREYPQVLIREKAERPIANQDLLDLITSSHAKRSDLRMREGLRKRLHNFQLLYLQTAKAVQTSFGGSGNWFTFLRGLAARAEDLNHAGRITGNGAEFIIDEILKARRKGLSLREIQSAIDLFISSQAPKSTLGGRRTRPESLQSNAGRLFQELVNIAIEFQEDI
jgi:hypothetical protein